MFDKLREALGLGPGPKIWTMPIKMYSWHRVGRTLYKPGAVLLLPAAEATWLHRAGYGELQLGSFSLPMQRGLRFDEPTPPVW